MFPTLHSKYILIAVLLVLDVSGAASAAAVSWSSMPPRAGAGVSTPASSGAEPPEAILYGFGGDPDGGYPSGGLIEDASGSLYGTTQDGGLAFPGANGLGGGTVFKLTPSASGSGFSEAVLYSFGASGAKDGYHPWLGSSLAIDPTGALYGTTNDGGAYRDRTTCTSGCGTVYKLTPTANGETETILHSFRGASDGGGPASNPILDRAGALYGTTVYGGGLGLASGVVYKLAPVGSGYAFSVLYSFGASGPSDGALPYGPLMLDERTGDLYGTTEFGGMNQNGLVFRLRPAASGYKYTIVYTFHGYDGANPLANLMIDKTGALYGTAGTGGPPSSNCSFNGGTCGVVFKLTPAGGGYSESVVYYFTGGLDGDAPASPLVADRVGNLYSTASSRGEYGFGTVFELARTPQGYREVTLHAFNGNSDGFEGTLTMSGVRFDGNDLVGETFGANEGPYVAGNIFALKLR